MSWKDRANSQEGTPCRTNIRTKSNPTESVQTRTESSNCLERGSRSCSRKWSHRFPSWLSSTPNQSKWVACQRPTIRDWSRMYRVLILLRTGRIYGEVQPSFSFRGRRHYLFPSCTLLGTYIERVVADSASAFRKDRISCSAIVERSLLYEQWIFNSVGTVARLKFSRLVLDTFFR